MSDKELRERAEPAEMRNERRTLTADDIAFFVGAWWVLCTELDVSPLDTNPYDVALELRQLRARAWETLR